MVETCESNGFDDNSGSFVALKWVGTEGTLAIRGNRHRYAREASRQTQCLPTESSTYTSMRPVSKSG